LSFIFGCKSLIYQRQGAGGPELREIVQRLQMAKDRTEKAQGNASHVILVKENLD